MKKGKSLIAILVLFFGVVIGVTFAYFQSSTSFENLFTTGIYRVVTTEVFESPTNWKPGETVTKTITTTNEGTIPAAVRLKIIEQLIDANGVDITEDFNFWEYIYENDFDYENWIYGDDDYFYYKYILNPGDTTTSIFSSLTLNPNLNDVVCTGDNSTKTCESTNPIVGATYKLTFVKETVQADKYQEVWGTDIELLDRKYGYKTYDSSNDTLTEMAFGENGYSALNSDVYLKFPVINDIVDENHVEVCFYDTVENKEYCLKNGMDDTENNIDIVNKYCDFDENTWSHQTNNSYILWEDSYEKFLIYSFFDGGYYLDSDTINVDIKNFGDMNKVAVKNVSKNIGCFVLSSGNYNCHSTDGR